MLPRCNRKGDLLGRNSIDGKCLFHLIFADDIILIAKSPEELESMLKDIHDVSKPVGLSMHLGKAKVICYDHTNESLITVEGKVIEEVDYHGKSVMSDGDLMPEIRWRIGLG